MDRVIGGHYRLRRRIGAGSFGEIYTAENLNSHRRVAVKMESVRSKVPQLAYESKLYAIFSGGTGIPRLHWFGTEGSQNVMVIDLLGKSLEDLFVQCRRKLSLKTVLMLADQMISCLEFIHSKNFIHRDIKPDNFVMGLGKSSNQVFIIDYGLSKKYRDQHTHNHIPYVEGKSLTGTARYASVGALKGNEQSRRDDLEALGYVWLYLLRGHLPWMGLNGRDQKQRYDRICEVKAKTSFTTLCEGFPEEFVKYFNYCRDLKFTEKPNYSELRKMFRDLFNKLGYVYDYKYDWVQNQTTTTSHSTPRAYESKVISSQNANVNQPQNVDYNLTKCNCQGSTLAKIRSIPVLLTEKSSTNEKDEKNIERNTKNDDRANAPNESSQIILSRKEAIPQSQIVGRNSIRDQRRNESEAARESVILTSRKRKHPSGNVSDAIPQSHLADKREMSRERANQQTESKTRRHHQHGNMSSLRNSGTAHREDRIVSQRSEKKTKVYDSNTRRIPYATNGSRFVGQSGIRNNENKKTIVPSWMDEPRKRYILSARKTIYMNHV